LGEVELVDFGAQLHFVVSHFGKRLQEQIRNALCAPRGPVEALEIVPLIGTWRDNKWITALRMILIAKDVPRESHLEQCATGAVMQFLHRGEVRIEIAPYCCRGRVGE